MSKRFPQPWLSLATAVVVLSGCSESGPARSITFGRVTYAGKPVERGHIRFLIEKQPTAQGTITNGDYRIDFRGGVPVGKGSVRIDAFTEAEQMVQLGVDRPPVAMHKQILPAKYNEQTTLSAEVVKGKQNEINFDLSP